MSAYRGDYEFHKFMISTLHCNYEIIRCMISPLHLHKFNAPDAKLNINADKHKNILRRH